LLGLDPLGIGESREGNRRVLIEWPLAAFYEVSEPDRMVKVLRVLSLFRDV
jgi:hypothetical protein